MLVETFLPGREFTVGIVGTAGKARALGAMEVLLGAAAEQGLYSYENKEHYEDRIDYCLLQEAPLAAAVEAVALAAWRALGCRDAGRVDVRLDAAGKPNFIEVNPLAGLNPVRSDLAILCRLRGISYHELIAAIVRSATARAGLSESVQQPPCAGVA